MLNFWAIIPARGGSKRVLRKNIKPLAGQSLVSRTVKTAIQAGCFSKIIVSTDDVEISAAALAAGAEVPFVRPAELADDSASSLDVILHAVDFLQRQTVSADAICLLQPTSPFLDPCHIRQAVALFETSNFTSLSSMVEVSQFPEWMFSLDSGRAIPESEAGIIAPRTEIKKRFIENGAIYLVKIDYLQNSKSLYDFLHHGAYVMIPEDSLDIDTPRDWDYAEYCLKKKAETA